MTRPSLIKKCLKTHHLGLSGWLSRPNIFPFSKFSPPYSSTDEGVVSHPVNKTFVINICGCGFMSRSTFDCLFPPLRAPFGFTKHQRFTTPIDCFNFLYIKYTNNLLGRRAACATPSEFNPLPLKYRHRQRSTLTQDTIFFSKLTLGSKRQNTGVPICTGLVNLAG